MAAHLLLPFLLLHLSGASFYYVEDAFKMKCVRDLSETCLRYVFIVHLPVTLYLLI